MNQAMMVIGIIVVAFIGLGFYIPYLVKKGVDVSGALAGTKTALDVADNVCDVLVGQYPELSVLSVVDRIITYAKQATEAAEQLYKTHQIEAAERKEVATNLIFEFLKASEDIEIDSNMENVINGCIEAAVFSLPKNNDPN